MEKIWKTKELVEPSEDLIQAAGNKLLAQLLVQRGMDTVKKIRDFLQPSQMKITSPFVFTDMEKSVDRIFNAIEKQEKIIVYGDFDADGVTSSSLLYKTLRHLNANVEFYIPNRENENHGLNSKALVKLIAKHKAKYACNITTVRNKRRSLRIRIEHRIRSYVVISQICPYFRFHQGDLILNHGNLRVHWRSILNRRFGLSRFLKN